MRYLILALILSACASRPVVPAAPPRAGAGTVAGAAGTAAAPARQAPDTVKSLASLSRGWNRIQGRDGTGCAQDSTFAFRVRPGLPDKVLIFLNGGGACWRGQECDPKSRPTYTMTADSANDASVRQGIFDVANKDNPVREFTMVYVPYCTGDLHLGTRTIDYESKSASGATRTFAVRHEGAANTEAVLDWVYANVKTPRVVFVAGSSAGAVPSPVVAAKLARHYPRARVVQLGDAAGGYHTPAVTPVLAGWGATDYLRRDNAFRSLDSANFTFEALYIRAARAAPRVRFAQFNTTEDATQIFFLSLLGVRGTPLTKLLAVDLDEVRNGTPWFRSYLAPGKAHTILRSNALYTTKVDGIAFRDWLAGLIDGDPVADVGSRLLPRKTAR